MFYSSAPLFEVFLVSKKYRNLIFILVLASFIKTDRQREFMITAFSGAMLFTIFLALVNWLGLFDFITKQKMIASFLKRSTSNSFIVFFAFLAMHKFQRAKSGRV